MPLHPKFQCLVDRLMDCSFPGNNFASHSLEILDEQSSSPHGVDAANDHFKLHIPYAGHTLVWEVRFDPFQETQAPDFLFDDESFTLSLDVDMLSSAVPSLLNWNVENPDSLFNVLQELLNLYTDYQLKVLSEEGSSLKEDCSKLLKDLGLRRNQIQVLQGGSQLIPQFSSCATRPSKDAVSIVLLKLEAQIDCESIAEEFRDFALQFTMQEYPEDIVILHINPVLSMLLGDKADLMIPNYSKGLGLYSYVENFKDIMKDTLQMVESDISKREEFHLLLFYELDKMSRELENFTCKAIELSSLESTASSYLLKDDWFHVVLLTETPPRLSKPKVFLRSITTGSNHEVQLDSSSAWDPHKILKDVLEAISELKDEVSTSFN